MADQGGISDWAILNETRHEEDPNASAGYQAGGESLGAALTGSPGPGSPSSPGGVLAFDKGQQTASATVNAMAEARLRVQTADANDTMAKTFLDPTFNPMGIQLSPDMRALYASLAHSGHPEYAEAIINSFAAQIKAKSTAELHDANTAPDQRMRDLQTLAPGSFAPKETANGQGYFNPAIVGQPGTEQGATAPPPGAPGPAGPGAPLYMSPAGQAAEAAGTAEKNAQTEAAAHRMTLQNFSPQGQAEMTMLINHGFVDGANIPRSLSQNEGAVHAFYRAMFPGQAEPAAEGATPAAHPAAAPGSPNAPSQPGQPNSPAAAPTLLPNPSGVSHLERAASMRDFSSNSQQSSGGKITRGIAVSNHMALLDQLADASQSNADPRRIQQLESALGTELGHAGPIKLNLAAQLVGSELANFIQATGGGEAERDRYAEPFRNANNATVIHGATDAARGFMGGQFDSLRTKWYTHGNTDNFSQKFLAGSPAADKVLQEFDDANNIDHNTGRPFQRTGAGGPGATTETPAAKPAKPAPAAIPPALRALYAPGG